ncbi:MAG: HAD-IA family hydrolase [Acidobacteriota bacterium]
MPPPSPQDIRLLIFDLDGTLIDSKLDLALSVNHMSVEMGRGTLDHSTIFSYVGRGAPLLVRRVLGVPSPEEPVSDVEVEKGLEIFLNYYRDHMLDNTVTYPGVREALDTLKAEGGHTLAVLTNKPVRFSREILKGLGLSHHFVEVYGGNSFEVKKPDPVGIRKLLEDTGAGPRETMIVGDSDTDVLTGRNAGVWTCGVTYGFGSYTLPQAPPDFLLDNLRELPPLLNGYPKN